MSFLPCSFNFFTPPHYSIVYFLPCNFTFLLILHTPSITSHYLIVTLTFALLSLVRFLWHLLLDCCPFSSSLFFILCPPPLPLFPSPPNLPLLHSSPSHSFSVSIFPSYLSSLLPFPHITSCSPPPLPFCHPFLLFPHFLLVLHLTF